MSQREPIFHMHPGIVLLLSGIIGVHIGLSLLQQYDTSIFLWMHELLAFNPDRYRDTSHNIAGGAIAGITSFFTYIFVQASFEHLIVNLAFILALGSVLAHRMGGVNFLIYSALCALGGSVLHLWFYWLKGHPIIGASPLPTGYFAGVIILMVSALRHNQFKWLVYFPRKINALTPKQTLTDPLLLLLVVLWTTANYLLAFMDPSGNSSTVVAWEAHLGGFIAGFASFWLLDYRKKKSSKMSRDRSDKSNDMSDPAG